MNLNAISNGVAYFSARPIRGFRNFQSMRLEHGDVKHQRCKVINTNILTHQVKTSSTGKGLTVQRLNREGEESGLTTLRRNLQHARRIALGRDVKEIPSR